MKKLLLLFFVVAIFIIGCENQEYYGDDDCFYLFTRERLFASTDNEKIIKYVETTIKYYIPNKNIKIVKIEKEEISGRYIAQAKINNDDFLIFVSNRQGFLKTEIKCIKQKFN